MGSAVKFFAVLAISALASSETPTGYSYGEPAAINFIPNNEIPSGPPLIPEYNYQITSTDFVSEPQVLNLAPQANIEFTPQTAPNSLFQYSPAPNPLPEYNPLISSISVQLPQQIPSVVYNQETIIEHQPIAPVPQFVQNEQFSSNVGSSNFAETIIENQPLLQIPQTAPALQYAPSIPSIQNIPVNHPVVEVAKSAPPPPFLNSGSSIALPSLIPPVNFVTGPGREDSFVGDAHTGGVLDHQIVNQIEDFVLQEEIRSQNSYEGSESNNSFSVPTGQNNIIGVSLGAPRRSLAVIEYTLNSEGRAPQQKQSVHLQSQKQFVQTGPHIQAQKLQEPQNKYAQQAPQIQHQQPIQQQQTFQQVQQLRTIPQQIINPVPQVQYQQPIQQQQTFQQVQQFQTTPQRVISPEPQIQFAQQAPQIQYQQHIPQQQIVQHAQQFETIPQQIISVEPQVRFGEQTPQIQYQQPAPQQQIVQQVQQIETIPQQIINPEPQIQFAQQVPQIQHQQSIQQQIPQQIPQIQQQIQPEEIIAPRINVQQFEQQAPQENFLEQISSGQGSVIQSVEDEPQIHVLQPIKQDIPKLQDNPKQILNFRPEIQQHKVELVKETQTPISQNTQFVAKPQPKPQPKPQIQEQAQFKPTLQTNQNFGGGNSFQQKIMQMLKQKLQKLLPQRQQQQQLQPRPAPQQDQRPNIRPKQDPIPKPQTQPKPQITEIRGGDVQQLPQLSPITDFKSGQNNQIIATSEEDGFATYGNPRKRSPRL